MDRAKAGGPRRAPNPLIREYFKEAEKPVDGGSWLDRPEFPTADEVLDTDVHSLGSSDIVELVPNKPKGAWESVGAYLGALSELQREDGVRPTREAVLNVRINPKGDEDSFNGAIGIYEKVHICEIVCSNRGISLRVTFSVRRAGKNIIWEQSKRLISGSLVVLTPSDDVFQSKAIVATVACRTIQMVSQNPPEVDLFIPDPDKLEIDPALEFVMVEERGGFYEAKRHNLMALRMMMREPFPLQEHLVGVQTEVAPPRYVMDHPEADLTSVLHNEEHETYTNVNMLHEWPVQPSSDLDASQLDALRRLLTKRLAICQGPPGTGKTFISVQAIKIILANRKSDVSPIIIACQTNHAVDQILRQISVFEPEFARLGGRSKDQDVIKARTLHELRNASSESPLGGGFYSPAKKKMKLLEKEIELLLSPLKPDKSEPLDFRLLEKIGIITSRQADSLEKGASRWVQDKLQDIKEARTSPFFVWLGKSLIAVPHKQEQEDFGFELEEADLAFEQLRDQEAENLTKDDEAEFEKPSGKSFPIADNFTCRKVLGMTEKKVKTALKQEDLWKIPEIVRPALYRYMQAELKKVILRDFRQKAKVYNKLAMEHRISQWEQDEGLLKNQKVIGMTTTGLSKYRGLISALQPKIVLIEEAAETLEPPVTVACMPSVQHLMLVGDHKQLRPHTHVKALENKPFSLNISLFERMINNRVEFSALSKQRRMIPEIRRILYPIYGKLIQDHDSVLDPQKRPNVPGMGGVNSFFFTHYAIEQRDEHMSAFNPEEVDMIVGFVEYLIYNGVDTKDITILTFYNGQRKRLLCCLRQRISLSGTYFNVVTVDSYQGEENKIVILSLVRSNREGNIGFLGVDNRVCVALSRAQCGLYIFGNGHLLFDVHKTWAKVIEILAGSRRKSDRPKIEPLIRIDERLPLRCTNHNMVTLIASPSDWEDNHGGCQQKCNGRLLCGHQCVLNCHPFSHERVSCQQVCGKPLPCGHGVCDIECAKKCICPFCNKECSPPPTPPPHQCLPSLDGTNQSLHGSAEESPTRFAMEGVDDEFGLSSMLLIDVDQVGKEVYGVGKRGDQGKVTILGMEGEDRVLATGDKGHVAKMGGMDGGGAGARKSPVRKALAEMQEMEKGLEARRENEEKIYWSKMESLLD
ncbi:hypothetical protein M433DRAFT_64459 [Acidomyces richmondensis BFW]|nr:MAG: hypothetical protein FE78DRAFT_144685 [Acidomyces sp. 'richmondensis']KYG46772.1 hypothetical protein M433DRAFT_64459 [Acidomyces richmondensis BFW]